MNQIELVTGLPDWHWTPHCAEELNMTGQELIDLSDFVWQVGNVAVAGFIHSSLVNPPWMWFVLAEGTTISDLVDFRRLTLLIPKGTMTAVAANFKTGLRFAKLYGFVETGVIEHYFDRPYQLMRKD